MSVSAGETCSWERLSMSLRLASTRPESRLATSSGRGSCDELPVVSTEEYFDNHTTVRPRRCRHRAAMSVDYGFDNCEAEPVAAGQSAPRSVNSLERLQHPVDRRGRYRSAAVGDRKHASTTPHLGHHFKPPTGSVVAYGVIHEIDEAFVFARSIPTYAATVAIWTLGEIGSNAVGPAMVADLAPSHLRGHYNGVYGAVWGGVCRCSFAWSRDAGPSWRELAVGWMRRAGDGSGCCRPCAGTGSRAAPVGAAERRLTAMSARGFQTRSIVPLRFAEMNEGTAVLSGLAMM